MRRKFNTEAGFTLIELMMVLLIIGVTTKIVAVSFEDIGYTARYEQTVERMNSIKEAILGNPRQVINGQQAVSGFVADMGRLPNNIHELLEREYCSDRSYSTPTDCTNNGAAWHEVATPYDSYHCTVPGYYNSLDCTNNTGNWEQNLGGLAIGWRGPYLSASGSALKGDAITDGWGREAQGYCSDSTITSSALCTAPALWTLSVADHNYGWYYDAVTNAPDLTFFSYGKDHVWGGLDYDADYPIVRPVFPSDWMISINGGLNISFIKPTGKSPPISSCTDTTKTTKATCTAPETWYGGCNNAGFYNKDSCTAASWSLCSDGTSATKAACVLAGKIWYGEGFGCSDQSKSNKALCVSPSVWRSCTDDGTITTKSACLSAGETWYGENIFSINIPSTTQICMNIFYRDSITSLVTRIISDPITIDENGAYQTINFNFTNPPLIPVGANAIGIYKYDGDCDPVNNPLYPADRQNPIQVDFHPHTTLPVINW